MLTAYSGGLIGGHMRVVGLVLLVVGGIVMCAGLALIPLPGPGSLFIAAALVLLVPGVAFAVVGKSRPAASER